MGNERPVGDGEWKMGHRRVAPAARGWAPLEGFKEEEEHLIMIEASNSSNCTSQAENTHCLLFVLCCDGAGKVNGNIDDD